jgi:transcription initiation factor TFIID subunit 1
MRDGGAVGEDGSPEPTTEKVTGTTRKCANCGQVGHIKTNKKYVCPCYSQEDNLNIAPNNRPGKVTGRKEANNSIPKPQKPGKRGRPRKGDAFWDPNAWKASDFPNTMEDSAVPTTTRPKRVRFEEAE